MYYNNEKFNNINSMLAPLEKNINYLYSTINDTNNNIKKFNYSVKPNSENKIIVESQIAKINNLQSTLPSILNNISNGFTQIIN